MAGLFSSATLEQVRAASDIVEVIGSYFPLKRAGANFVALCPFHKEKTPSFSVNPHRQIFHCFGCHKGGDIFSFVQEYESITFTEAVRRLAERARIPLEVEKDPAQLKNRFLKETLLQIHEQITQRWQAALINDAAGQIARDYLTKRGVPAEAVKLFRLGCAPDAWDDTVNWSRSKGYEPALVEQAGLILRKEGSDHYYDRFRGRLIFPICDEQGRVIGFSGRVLAGDEKTAKYVNSPETPIFTKGKVFYGLDKSRRAILDAGHAVVCEGQLDLIACYMAGVQNIVAPQGTALTAEHTRILKRYVDEVVLCFDSDAAGRNAAIRALDDLLASGLAIRVAAVPAPHDPDSFIKEFGGAAFQQLIDRAEGFFDFYLNHLCATNDVNTDKGRRVVVEEMATALGKTGNELLLDKYAREAGARMGVSPISAIAEFRKSLRSVAPPKGDQLHAEKEEKLRPSNQDLWLLKLLLQNDECVEWLATHLEPEWVADLVVRGIVNLRIASHLEHSWQGFTSFLAQFQEPSAKALMVEALNLNIAEDHFKNRPVPRQLDQIKDFVLNIRNDFIERRRSVLLQHANDPTLPDAEREKLLHQRFELARQKSEPLRPRTCRVS